MTIRNASEIEQRKFDIDLNGPQGNAFVLLGYARTYGKQLGYDTDKIYEEMTSGDYENLVETFDSYFGDIFTLYR